MVKPAIGEKALVLLTVGYILFKLFSFKFALLIVIAGVLAQTAYVKWKLTVWKRLNVPGPPPTLFFGNALSFLDGNMHLKQIEWSKKYGRIFGAYLATKPDLSVSDLELLRHVLVKDFSNFTNRIDMIDPADRIESEKKQRSIFDNVLTVLVDDKWRRVRNTITPAFTSGKLKHMVPLLDDCIEKFSRELEKKSATGKPIKIKDEFRLFTMDVIASVAFGTDVDTYNNPNNPVIFYSNKINDFSLKNIRLWIAISFPYITTKILDWFGVQLLFGDVEKFFKQYLTDMIEQRKHAEKSRPDFLQLLINAETSGAIDGEAHSGPHDSAALESSTAGKLSTREIISQAVLFLNAGHETTATTLSFLAWVLTVYPDVQKRCYDEVRQVLGPESQKEADRSVYDLVMNRLTYMEMVIQETLRMFPPAIRFDRECSKDYEAMGCFIPKGSQVSVPVYAIHHDPEYYSDPEMFIPERFSPEQKASRDPLLYLPFGYGNRNCIGMRFALLEMKFALAKLIQEFEFLPCDSTERPPLSIDCTALMKPRKPFEILLKKRIVE